MTKGRANIKRSQATVATKKIEYVLRIPGLEDVAKTLQIQNYANSTPLDKKQIAKPTKVTSDAASLMHSTITEVASDVGKNIIFDSIKTSVNRYVSMSDDYVSSNYLTNVSSSLSTIISLGKTASSSFKTASAIGGPILGGLIAAVNTSVELGKQQYEYSKKMVEYKTALNTTNIETEFRQQRAGLYNGNRGTEN